MRVDLGAAGSELYGATEGIFNPRLEQPRELPLVPGRVSVICPTTDDRALFHTQLYGCFAAQNWPDKELVVIDTGAYPSPFLRMKAFEDPRVVYRHFRMMGSSWSVGLKRNLAVHLASGEVVAHFDDDDLYAPCYLDRMLAALASADAVTLSSWFVCDACTGLVAWVSPEDDLRISPDTREGWVLGYGFSHVYRREACVLHPFRHAHFAEDYEFLLELKRAAMSGGHGCGVRTHRDVEGIVLHMQQGTNMSHSHALVEVKSERVQSLQVACLPSFEEQFGFLRGQGLTSPFVSIGEAFRMYLRPTPHQRMAEMRKALQGVGVALRPACQDLGLCEAFPALASCVVRRRDSFIVEPGRFFEAACRFSDEAVLPEDVARVTTAERVALLHLARVLLKRCPARLALAASCEGWLRLQLWNLSHIAIVPLLVQFARHFPRVRLEVHFESEGVMDDPGQSQRELMLHLLAQQRWSSEWDMAA